MISRSGMLAVTLTLRLIGLRRDDVDVTRR